MSDPKLQDAIAVVGMACRFPHARDLSALWRVLRTGEVTFEDIDDSRWKHSSFFEPGDVRAADKTYVRKGAFIEEHDAFAALHYGIAPRRVQVTDPQQRLMVEVTRQCLQDAGYEAKALDRANTGVFVGISTNEFKDWHSARLRAQMLIDGTFGDALEGAEAAALQAAVADSVPMRAFSIAGNLLNMSAATVSQTFDFGGPSLALDTACSSALVAIHNAVLNLRTRQCNVALAGGVYVNLTPDNLIGFSRIGAISPAGLCRPFDAKADGFVMGEGVGVVMLKRLEDALADGDRVYAVIRGSGCNNDGRGDGPMTPRPEGQMQAMERAFAGLPFGPASVGYVETHGTATTVGDVVEVGALTHFFQAAGDQATQRCWLGSIKANIGHTMSAAGVAGFIKATLSLHHRQIAPQPSVEELNPRLNLERSPFKVPQQLMEWAHQGPAPRRAAVSSFGFGGTNAHVVLEEAPSAVAAPQQHERPHLFTVSAATPALLARHLDELAQTVEAEALAPDAVALTLASRAAFDVRLCFTATTRAQLLHRLRDAASALRTEGGMPPGTHLSLAPLPPEARKAAFLFPGQGAQRVGLLREVVERFPSIRTRLLALDAAAREASGCSLVEALYPVAPFDAQAAQAHLTRTEVCQPAMAALGLALAEWLASVGVTPSVVVGHSLGEFAAAAAAGMLSGEDAVRLVAQRGQLMNALGLQDNGAMLAVMAPAAQVLPALEGLIPGLSSEAASATASSTTASSTTASSTNGPSANALSANAPSANARIGGAALAGADQSQLSVWPANFNHPSQLVLSGTTAGIAAARQRLESRGFKVAALDVSHAFHSPLMQGIDAGMARLLQALPISSGNVPVVSCISGRPYADVDEARATWVRHATAPVDFVQAMQSCEAAGANLFVQVGAGGALLAFARGATDAQAHTFLSLGPTDFGDGGAQLLETLGQLWLRGVEVQRPRLVEGARLTTLPPTPLVTQRYGVVERTGRTPHLPLAAPAARTPIPNTTKAVPMNDLVALFREQMALMQSQADVLKAQAQALSTLSGADVAQLAAALPAPLPAPAAPPAAPSKGAPNFSNLVAPKGSPILNEALTRELPPAPKAPAPAAAPARDYTAEATPAVLEAVSRISAFPAATLKLEQTLVGELGFDSLMLVELDQAVGKAFPTLGGLPRELFGKATTVRDIVAHIASVLGGEVPAASAAAAKAVTLPVERYAPVVVSAPLAALRESVSTFEHPLLVTADQRGVAARVVALLEQRGVRARVGGLEGAEPVSGIIDLSSLEAAQRDAANQSAPASRRNGGAALSTASTTSHPDGAAALGSASTTAPAAGARGDNASAERSSSADSSRAAGANGAVGMMGITASAALIGPAVGASPAADPQRPTGAGAGLDFKGPVHHLLAAARRATAQSEVFLTVTALGGRFGLDALAPAALGQVGAAGFTRALAQEWPEATVKALDVDPSLEADALARFIVGELLSGDRTAEVGLTAQGRTAVALKPAPLAKDAGRALRPDDVVLVTGGAKGVGLTLATALAKAVGCTVVLTGRSAASPESAAACAQVKAAGARACSYLPLDVRDAAAVAAALAQVRAQAGRLTGVVHAAGVLADALVGNKDSAAVDAVLSTKVGGALALLEATAGDALALFVGVGSWAGRFGNRGQVDYAAANAMLAALARRARPGLRSVVIDFPPFEDSAMARKIPGFLKAEMVKAGVTFLSDAEGAQAFLTELSSGSGEVLVGRAVPERTLEHRAQFPVSRLNHVYLNDHTMNGQRVLPLAAAVDHLTAAAMDAGLGSEAFTVRDFRLERPVLVPDTTWLEVSASRTLRAGTAGDFTVELRQGHALAYRGTVAQAQGVELPALPTANQPLPLSLREFYDGFTFHGPRLQGITRIDGVGDDGIVGWVKGSTPADWVKEPLRSAWTVDPLLLDASFQLGGYWAWTRFQRAGFPLGFAEYTQLKPFGRGPVKCTVRFEQSQDDLFLGTLVWHSESGELLAVMKGARAEFKKRDPQFSASASSAPAAVAAPSSASAATAAPAAAPAPIDEASWNPAKFPEYEELLERIQLAEAFGLKNPYFSVQEGICGDTTVVGGKKMINFSSYNYVGNSGDPKVSRAAQDAITQYGTSVSASRVASGERPLTLELEAALAKFFGTEDCIALVSGHATNVTVIGHVVGPGDLILHDVLAHDSIVQGAKLSGAKRRPFPHNDWEALDRALEQLRPHFRRVLICIEGTYSMDGDIPDLPKFIAVKKKHKALLLVDEAHSAGTVGPTGRGVGEYWNIDRHDVDMFMGTLSKSFASCGGYICGSKALVEFLKYTTPGFVYSVGLSPPNAAAALQSLKNLEAEPQRVQKAQANARLFLKLLNERGVDTGMSKDTAVVPAIIGNSILCLQLSDRLKSRGINVQPILYPAVEEHLARLRFFVSSLHGEEQLRTAATILSEEYEALKAQHAAEAVA